MKRRTAKIVLLITGGSVLSIRNNTELLWIESDRDIDEWLSEIPELNLIANIEPIIIAGEHEPFDITHVESIAKNINDMKDDVDGFVVLARGEHMLITAIALEFMLQGLGKPVVTTGSRRIPSDISALEIRNLVKLGSLGLRSNLVNAIQIAVTPDFQSHALMFGNRILKPTSALVESEDGINFLGAVRRSYLGKVDFGISISKRVTNLGGSYRYYPSLSRDVLIVDSREQLSLSTPVFLGKKNKTEAALLVKLHPGDSVAQIEEHKLLDQFNRVIIYGLDHHQKHMHIDPSDMTWETAMVKTLWANAASSDDVQFKTLVSRDIIGEYNRI